MQSQFFNTHTVRQLKMLTIECSPTPIEYLDDLENLGDLEDIGEIET